MRPHHSSASPARRPLLRWLLLAAGVLLLMVVGGWMITGRMAARQTARQLAASRERGEPTTPAELAAYYSLPGNELDVSQLWLGAIAPFDTEQFADRAKDLPIVGSADATIPPPGQPWPEREAVEKLLQEYQLQLDQMHQAAAAGGAARYPIDPSQGFSMLLTHAQQLRGGARMLQLEAHATAHRGDAALAADCLIALHRAGDSLEYEPVLVSQLVRIAICSMAVNSLGELLPHVKFSDAELQRLSDELGAGDFQPGHYRAMVGERAIGSTAILSPDKMGMPPSLLLKLTRRGDLAEYLSVTGQVVQAAQLPMTDALDEYERITFEAQAAMSSNFARLRRPMTLMLLPAYQASLSATARANAARDMAAAAIAVERYRRRHGELPDSLEVLTPKFLPVVPLDPFDGQPLRYKLEGSTVMLYTISQDRVDNGGDEQADSVLRLEY